MKKPLLILMASFGLLLSAAPAKADTNITIISRGRPVHYHGPQRHRPPHYYRHSPRVVFAPVYAPPPVIYQTTVVRPTVRYVSDATLEATPLSPSYVDSWGRTCREYQSVATVARRSESVYGTACLQPDGAWRVVN